MKAIIALQSLAAAMALADSGSSHSYRYVPVDDGRQRQREKDARLARAKGQAPPSPRILTDTDDARLREAAERRARKVQRQAKGFATPPHEGSDTSSNGGRND